VPYTTAGQGWPEPSPYDAVMLDRKVRFVGDRVAVVAAEDPELARRGLRRHRGASTRSCPRCSTRSRRWPRARP
jgi:hypothetical protein